MKIFIAYFELKNVKNKIIQHHMQNATQQGKTNAKTRVQYFNSKHLTRKHFIQSTLYYITAFTVNMEAIY